MSQVDVIDTILVEHRNAIVIELRSEMPELAPQKQDYYDAVFPPAADSAAELSSIERWLIAIRTASHTRSASVIEWYSEQAQLESVSEEFLRTTRDFSTAWVAIPARRRSCVMSI